MKTLAKILIVVAAAVGVVAAVALKQTKSLVQSDTPASTLTAVASAPTEAAAAQAIPAAQTRTANPVTAVKLPKMVDLGADNCIPCKMMAPILEELKREYAGRLEVEFIDVWKNPDTNQRYGIQMIPTQIFYDAEGKERFRHVGFIGKEDILAKFRELGVDLTQK